MFDPLFAGCMPPASSLGGKGESGAQNLVLALSPCFLLHALLTQGVERMPLKRRVVGSSPTGRTKADGLAVHLKNAPGNRQMGCKAFHGWVAQLVERQFHDLKVGGPSPPPTTLTAAIGLSYFVCWKLAERQSLVPPSSLSSNARPAPNAARLK